MKKLKLLFLGLLFTIGVFSQTFDPANHEGGVKIGSDLIVESVYVFGGDTIVRIAGHDFLLSDIRLKLSISDTAVMLTPYALLSEAGSAYNSGSGITIDGSNNIDLGGALDALAIITGTEVNYLEIRMSDASDRSTKLVFQGDLSMRAYTGDDHTGDSSFVTVDSNLVSMGIYDGVAIKSITIDTTNARGIEVRDDDAGVGLKFYADYSAVATALSLTPKSYQDLHLGSQDLNSTVYNPGDAEHGDVMTWDTVSSQYIMTDVIAVTEAAGIMIVTCDTILYDDTTIDTAAVLSVAAVVWDIQVYVKTAFTGTGTDLLDIGIDGEGERYDADLDMSIADKWYGVANVSDRMAATTEIIYQYFDTNADAGAGEAYIYVRYSIH